MNIVRLPSLPRLIWQSPLIFRNAGLFLKVGNTRYCIWRCGS